MGLVHQNTDHRRGWPYPQPNGFDPGLAPVLGYLDDLLLAPLGIALTLKMIPQAVKAQKTLGQLQEENV